MLSANPKNTNPLRLGEEARKIQSALKLAKSRDQFGIATEWAVRVEDLSINIDGQNTYPAGVTALA